jgi:hypothetical protein
MLLLTWHGTILRVEQAENRLTHAPPVPVRDAARDFSVELPADALALPHALDDETRVVAARHAGAVHLVRGSQYLCVEPAGAFPAFDRKAGGKWESFLALTDAEASALRALLGGAWHPEDADEDAAAPLPIALDPGFVLVVGSERLDLTVRRPVHADDGAMLIPWPEGPARLRQRAAREAANEIHLRRTPAAGLARPVASEAEFHAAAPTRLLLPASEELYFPPLTAAIADRDWALEHAWPAPPQPGRHRCQSSVVHEAHKFVLLARGVEGMVFDPAGISSEAGYLSNIAANLPRHFAREGDEIFLSAAALQDAAVLRGPHAVFYGGNLVNRYHWMIDGLVPLVMLHPFLPPETTLLLPATLPALSGSAGFDHLDLLEAFGCGDMRRVAPASQVCFVEQVFRPDHCFVHQMPAAALQAARALVFARLPPAGPPTRRVLLAPRAPRDFSNRAVVEQIATKAGLEIVDFEALDLTAQIDLFRHARLIVATHGGALAHLLFCPPGGAVLELSPACQFRPHFSQLAGKLGLLHAVLPCQTVGNSFYTALQVPAPRLVVTLDVLQTRLALTDAAA